MTRLYAPSTNPVTQPWGAEFYNFNGKHYPDGFYRTKYKWHGHNGIDYSFGPDRNVYAAAAGTVVFADWGYKQALGWFPDGGIVTMIDHGDFYTVYAHQYENDKVRAGRKVTAGQIIGTIGGTGGVAGEHLHFEVIPKNPNFANGWAGRSKPVLVSTRPATIGAASGTITKEDTLSAAEVKELKAYIDAKHKELHQAVREDLAGLIRRHVPRASMTSNVASAEGKEQQITVETQLRWLDKMLREVRSIARVGLTDEQIAEAVREAMADVVEVNVTVTGKDAK